MNKKKILIEFVLMKGTIDVPEKRPVAIWYSQLCVSISEAVVLAPELIDHQSMSPSWPYNFYLKHLLIVALVSEIV